MAISNQAQEKSCEGSETRLYALTGLYGNLRVESKGHESPRVPDNQAVQCLWSNEAIDGFLRSEKGSVQTMQTEEVCGISRKQQGEDKGVFAEMVFAEQAARSFSVQGV